MKSPYLRDNLLSRQVVIALRYHRRDDVHIVYRNGVSREGVREDSLHKDTKNFSIGKEQLTMDNGQLADYFSTVCFKPVKHRYLHGRAAICIGAVHIDA